MQSVQTCTCKNDTDFAAWRDKLIRDGVAGIQEWDKAVHDYADPGKKKPKNPDKIGPPISYMKECWGVSAPSIHDESSGVVSFLSRRSHKFVNTYTSKSTHHCGPSQQSPGSHKVPVPAVYHCCV